MKIKLFGPFILSVVIFFSCNKSDDCSCPADIRNKWEVTKFMSIESMYYGKENGYNPILEFKTDGFLNFQLDANEGTGTFEISANNDLEISNLGWTDMCCDSDFSEKFVEMLPQVTSYSIEKEILKLVVTEWGWIELKLLK